MDAHAKTESYGQSVLRRFESHGLWIGLGLGLLTGVLVSGPNFREWAAQTSFWVTFACTLGGGVIGYFAGTIAAASLAQGPGGGFGGSGDRGIHSADGDGGSSAGGDGGGGGGD